jgi:hypothetical protein
MSKMGCCCVNRPRTASSMRRMSPDELPQLRNFIRAEMTLVGPSPFPAYQAERFDPDFPGALREGAAGADRPLASVLVQQREPRHPEESGSPLNPQLVNLARSLYPLDPLAVPAVITTHGALTDCNAPGATGRDAKVVGDSLHAEPSCGSLHDGNCNVRATSKSLLHDQLRWSCSRCSRNFWQSTCVDAGSRLPPNGYLVRVEK